MLGSVLSKKENSVSKFHSLQMISITGDPVDFSQYKGHKCLVVNLASQ